MSMTDIAVSELSDEHLLASARSGDSAAFSELWHRHQRAAIRMAKSFTRMDAEDLVAEAFTSVLDTIQRGGGPSGAFRPYLYAVIRNLARRSYHGQRELTIEDIVAVADSQDDNHDDLPRRVDRDLIIRAFSSLPERWQTVLWYTAVEGMPPREVGPLLGISDNAVSALAVRARDGLREAWIQAHVTSTARTGECGWVVAHLGAHLGDGLGKRDSARMSKHLSTCDDCQALGLEAQQTSSMLAPSLIPAIVGTSAGAVWLQGAVGAGAASALAFTGVGGLGAAGMAGIGLASGGALTSWLVAASVTALVVTGAVVVLPRAFDPETGTGGPTITVEPPGGGSGGGTGGGDETTLTGDGTIGTGDGSGDGSGGDGLLNGTGGLLGGVGDTLDGVGGILDGTLDGVGGTVGGVLDGVGGTVGGVLDGVGGTVGGVLDGVGGVLDGLTGGNTGSTVTGAVGDVVNGVTGAVGDVVGGVTGAVGDVVGGVADGVGDVLGGLGGLLGGGKGKK